jgi:hypothetical protein
MHCVELDPTCVSQLAVDSNASALHVAATWSGSIGRTLCQYLANHIDINMPDIKGYTPLHYASIAGVCDTVEYLVQQLGADIESTTQFGSTALAVFWLNIAFERQHDRIQAPKSVDVCEMCTSAIQ